MKNIKNNYLIFMLVFIFLFILKMNFCYADTFKGKINDKNVSLRSGPGTKYERIKTLTKDSEYNLVDENKVNDEKGCPDGWYKIYYDASDVGYVCSTYVDVSKITYNDTPTNSCEEELQASGFPKTYWPGLCSLKEKHPTWIFKPILTNLDFKDAVQSESVCGKSYIASSNEENIDKTCKNPYSKTWYPASNKAVAYYMDPRNWLNENTIFQFEYLKYSESLKEKYPSAVSNVIKNADFYKYHLGIGNDLGVIINDASLNANVSPIFISGRILQELGNSNSLYNLYSGIYDGDNGIYKGYYNFYNFGVTDSCATSKGTTVCGLDYAVSKGWNSLYNALYGGAKGIASSYIAVGQYSGYLQKFNVVPTSISKLYGHQYMTNIAAPSSESKTTYKSYQNMEILDSDFIFYIPVYNNMDDNITSEDNGAVETPEEDEKTIIDISTIIISSGYKYQSGYIMGIKPSTSVSTVKNAIESIAGLNSATIKDSKDNIVNDGLIGTGFKVEVSNSEKSETLVVVINGDTSGDGKINALDLLQVQKYILGTYKLSGEYNEAGDTSKDGKINALDLLQVQKEILGTYEIEQ